MCCPVLWPQIFGGAVEEGVVNSSLSLLQSQFVLDTGMSRLNTTNSSRKKQISGLSLVSLYWQVLESVKAEG